jgi:hypothetical protein
MSAFRSEALKKEWSLLPWEGARLFVVSFLVLFFELLCIRWIPSYIRYLSYFSNFVLLSCFLGMGIGLLLARRRWDFLSLFPPLLLLFVIIVSYVKFELKIETGDALYFQSTEVEEEQIEGKYLLSFVVVFVTLLFAFLSYEMGVLFDRFKPLTAYAWNIGGSMAGIAAFFIISMLRIPPVWWFLVTAVGVVLLLRASASSILVAFLSLASTVYVAYKLQGDAYWSPYYRITMEDRPGGGKVLNVNNIGHQTMQLPEQKEGFYHVPYQSFKDNHFRRAMIIGAGSGTDVSFAIKYGVEEITAVEIDPVIYRLGKKHHPAAPYALPRVKVHINDARTFVRNDTNLYDLIIYALPDSLTLTSSFANLRLESYLFTEESFSDTKKRLAPGGLLVLYNYYREDWLIDRISARRHHLRRVGQGGRVHDRRQAGRPHEADREETRGPGAQVRHGRLALPVHEDGHRAGRVHQGPDRACPLRPHARSDRVAEENPVEDERPLLLPGGGLHAARDHEHRALLAPVRKHVDGQLAGLLRRAGHGHAGHLGVAPVHDPVALDSLRAALRDPAPQLPPAPGEPPDREPRPALRGREPHALLAHLPCQPDLYPDLQGGGGHGGHRPGLEHPGLALRRHVRVLVPGAGLPEPDPLRGALLRPQLRFPQYRGMEAPPGKGFLTVRH